MSRSNKAVRDECSHQTKKQEMMTLGSRGDSEVSETLD